MMHSWDRKFFECLILKIYIYKQLCNAQIYHKQVTSQAGTNIGALAMTSSNGAPERAILTHPHPSMQRTQQPDHHGPLKTPIGELCHSCCLCRGKN